jgi:D-sedoheptulose 7-phosphate isomerase
MSSFPSRYLDETIEIIRRIDAKSLDRLVEVIAAVRAGNGRLFIVGSGGGAAHASHAVGDFRKILRIEAYSPSDNVAELTARINDDSWASSYRDWLAGSRIGPRDGLLVLSVGGGSVSPPVSENLVRAIGLAREAGAVVCGIVGRDGGETAREADACVLVPVLAQERVTAHTEGLQSVILHLVISHPRLQPDVPRWESIGEMADAV